MDDTLVVDGAPYDLIYAWHTMEHVFDLNSTLEHISKLVRTDGLVFFGVPQFYEEHLFKLAHFLPHIHSFTKQSMTTLLDKHGFEVVFIDDNIRVLARKTGKQPLQKACKTEKDRTFQGLNGKFERDLCLKEIRSEPAREEDLLFFFSSGEPQNANFKNATNG